LSKPVDPPEPPPPPPKQAIYSIFVPDGIVAVPFDVKVCLKLG
jgi:hypothetical protein